MAAMAGRLVGKVVFITGAARGQGRGHAVRLAEEGADIIAVDLMAGVESVEYAMPTQTDMDQTVKQVEALGRRIVARRADVRDQGQLKAALEEGIAELGRLDIVAANAGIARAQPWDEVTPQQWQNMLDVNLTGTWNTIV